MYKENFEDLLEEEENLLKAVPKVKKAPPVKTNLGDLLDKWKKEQEKKDDNKTNKS